MFYEQYISEHWNVTMPAIQIINVHIIVEHTVCSVDLLQTKNDTLFLFEADWFALVISFFYVVKFLL